MSATKAKRPGSAARKAEADVQPQSAAAPSPFPPIADYAFLSNCHTGALVAPDGAIDWLCVPRFDSPSVFGTLLDRGAGSFRLGPFGINHPAAVVYEPGTNTLLTTWKTPTGWIMVRDALTMGPRHGEDEITPHTRPPADDDGDHMLVRTVLCLDGRVVDCRAHEVDNLYVGDTSFFPSIGAVNPALTAMANALRVGDHLLERMGAQRREASLV